MRYFKTILILLAILVSTTTTSQARDLHCQRQKDIATRAVRTTDRRLDRIDVLKDILLKRGEAVKDRPAEISRDESIARFCTAMSDLLHGMKRSLDAIEREADLLDNVMHACPSQRDWHTSRSRQLDMADVEEFFVWQSKELRGSYANLCE